jgi:hypothetical protein
MRKVIAPQIKLGEIDISNIEFDLQSRDEIPKLLIGLQHIYTNKKLFKKVSDILQKLIPKHISTDNGCPGMDLWKILVLGTVRLVCNWDYDKVHEIANNHKTLRQMLGHGVFDNRWYHLQTIKDNLRLFTPDILDEINQLVVNAGLKALKIKDDECLHGSCDSFVVETDVHYPTDINMLWDAARKVISLSARESAVHGLAGWRQHEHLIRKIKRQYRLIQKLKRSTSKNETKKAKREQEIIEAHQQYIDFVVPYLERTKTTLNDLQNSQKNNKKRIQKIDAYIQDAEFLISQIQRRVIQGEHIAHDEKIFSIFERHTEWISKGKAGVPQELGLMVCVLKEQHGFILHHRVMENEKDVDVAVPMTEAAQQKFPSLKSCSYDKGFYSPDNKKELAKLLDNVILPKKGKLSAADKAIERSEEFVQARYKHSAVESSINALENHGLDRCLDHGIDGFKRYVGLAVLARNIQILGHILQQQRLSKHKRFRETQVNKELININLN